eukprot:CAMPEP_0114580372 /NCGR_PEP_ID=MMETSP0125-20121206/4679_1 /TAXON_ID=485358 ORGANISM="Aristerostoma sp., Strain ATCC 50986" /NCGR_SAMPLE_ID=MMETSP0125 /ASSEMBLY_ACC=CAM_ASM_000245 /LENGTH=57 /DNA_ID=CAMNT_0001771911 /DNA_START=127 /DNA_END=300 /DNA_ORIENTATION=-
MIAYFFLYEVLPKSQNERSEKGNEMEINYRGNEDDEEEQLVLKAGAEVGEKAQEDLK